MLTMLQDLWYNWGLSDTTLVISSSQSELNNPRKFRLLDFLRSLLYSLHAETELRTSLGTCVMSFWLTREPARLSPYTEADFSLSTTVFEDLENMENIVFVSTTTALCDDSLTTESVSKEDAKAVHFRLWQQPGVGPVQQLPWYHVKKPVRPGPPPPDNYNIWSGQTL